MNTTAIDLSNSMQMYLVKIKRLRKGLEPVPLSVLAASLHISSVSVNEMCRKLDEMDLIRYLPYKGATLTEKGDQHACNILRRHRLWEVFLVDKLHFDYQHAHELADGLEHVTPIQLADRLDAYLQYPKQNPEGKLIPNAEASTAQPEQKTLADLPAGSNAIYSLNGTEQAAAEYLRANGIPNGARITTLAQSDQLILVKFGQHDLHLSMQIARGIRVFADEIVETHNEQKPKQSDKENNMDDIQTQIKTLKDLKNGESGIVTRVAGSGSVKQRMMDMGLVPGSEVSVVRVAPLGDPIEITLKGYNLSLRKSEAKDIFIEG